MNKAGDTGSVSPARIVAKTSRSAFPIAATLAKPSMRRITRPSIAVVTLVTLPSHSQVFRYSVLFTAHRSALSGVSAGQHSVSSRILTMETLCRLS
jgi:hypothetical protein